MPKPSGETAKRKFSDLLSIYATKSKATNKRSECVAESSSAASSSSSKITGTSISKVPSSTSAEAIEDPLATSKCAET